ncbi:putative 3'-5' exonuclease related to the exonuclease domain of PolB [Thalassoglobus neptunius]|uniref:Putative 3'-5' exonuclease related to the exonuclease domain of PolB n=1 Tax=Thalassoglobus neptunius TaxID=1938619 RepID=A0A5C5WIL1_9PLAN|nr:3'-5' exonuclease [Thalassoglobus neptunius]TWT49863.1 putative 3'-5' exonuclease related to the exonuclease domain of PolB [Thalassoglobus neptunius]
MRASSSEVAYLIFDVEAVGDGDLIAKVRYPTEKLSAPEGLRKYRDELLEKTGRDVLPPTFVLPASVAVAKVGRDFRLIGLSVLDEPDYRPHIITEGFWNGWRHYGRPTFVTFNGRGYDMPVLEYAAYRYGLAIPDWFNVSAPAYEQCRNRYNSRSHIDMMDLFSNFGATRMNGGLNLLANLIGKPGKSGIDGSQVQDMFDAGRLKEINDYCRCDVLDTYFVFLRTRVLLGLLSLEDEGTIVAETKAWLEDQRDNDQAIAHYLEGWGDWVPPPNPE